MMYFGIVGGLLLLQGAIVTYLWNFINGNSTEITELSLLEGVGLSAISYVFVFSCRYGWNGKGTAAFRFGKRPTLAQKCANMTPEQRAELRTELAEKCGCREQRVANSE